MIVTLRAVMGTKEMHSLVLLEREVGICYSADDHLTKSKARNANCAISWRLTDAMQTTP